MEYCKRKLKNTIFKFLNWIDIDQVKGRPTILIELAEMNNMELKHYKQELFPCSRSLNTL